MRLRAHLAEAFQTQRARLEQSRAGIEDAIRALQQVETASESIDRPLDQLATAMDMQDAIEAMRGYFTNEAWTKWGEQYFHDWPSAAWRVLFRDIEASLDRGPGERPGARTARSIDHALGREHRLGSSAVSRSS